MAKRILSVNYVRKRNILIEIISSLLLIFFVHSVISNYVSMQSLKNLLAFYTRYTAEAAWAIIITEAIIAILLLIPAVRGIGFAAVIVVALFAIYTVLKTPYFPHDFGGILNSLHSNQQICFYCLLAVLSITGLWLLLKGMTFKSKPETACSAVVS